MLIPQLILHSTTSVPFRILSIIIQTLFPLTILFGWQWIDVLSHYEQVRKDMEQWPVERLDEDINELAHSPPNVGADWHGVRILGHTAVVTCERRPRLMAFDLTSNSFRNTLHPRWEWKYTSNQSQQQQCGLDRQWWNMLSKLNDDNGSATKVKLQVR